MKNNLSDKLFALFGLDNDVHKKLWKYGSIYFTELLLLWIVTSNTQINYELIPDKYIGFPIDVIKIQTLGFLFGAIWFGYYMGEHKEKNKVNRINNLKQSLKWYWIGAFFSFVFSFIYLYFENQNIIKEYLDLLKWGFAISRFATCLGISGGIGINLTIISSLAKDGKHSAPILLFTVFGVMGTVICCILMLFNWKYMVSLIFFIGFVLGVWKWYTLMPIKDCQKDQNEHMDKEYTNDYEYCIKQQSFYSRVFSFVILGLPTFYLAGILASKADLLIDMGWFSNSNDLKSSKNLSSIFLGVQYMGFAIVCAIFSLPNKRIGRFIFFPFRTWISEHRKGILVFGSVLQIIFIGVFLFWENGISVYFSCIFILLSGAGIGLNWAIIMILIFEQEEFKHAKTFAATIIPNIIRFSLVLILAFPSILGMGNIEKDKFLKTINEKESEENKSDKGDIGYIVYSDTLETYSTNSKTYGTTEIANIVDKYKSVSEIKKLQGLAWLVYLPFIFTLFIFKDKGERNARYDLEERGLKQSVDDIINHQKFNNNLIFEKVNTEELIRGQFQELKKELRQKLKKLEFDLINFYYVLGDGALKRTDFDEQEKTNDRVEQIESILNKEKTDGLTNLLEIASDKRLNCVTVYKAKEKLDENLNYEDTIVIDIEPSISNIINNLKSKSIKISEKEESILKYNFYCHKEASKIYNKDYFVYIIRPITDVENAAVYLILLCSSRIGNDAISSLQTLIYLTLLKYSKLRQQQLEFSIKQVTTMLREEEDKNVILRKEKIKLEIELGIRQDRKNKIKNWKNMISKNNFKVLFEELQKYMEDFKLNQMGNMCHELLGRWNLNEADHQHGVLNNDEYTKKVNVIRIDLLKLLDDLKDMSTLY